MSLAPLVIVNPAAGGGRALRSVDWLRERLGARPDVRTRDHAPAGRRRDPCRRRRPSWSRSSDRRRWRRHGAGGRQRPARGRRAGSAGDRAARLRERPRPQPGAAGRARIRLEDRDRARNPSNRRGARATTAPAANAGSPPRAASASTRRWPPRWPIGAGGRRGAPATSLTTLTELRRFENRRIRLTIDGATETADVLFVAIANGAYYGGGMRIAPDAQPSTMAASTSAWSATSRGSPCCDSSRTCTAAPTSTIRR